MNNVKSSQAGVFLSFPYYPVYIVTVAYNMFVELAWIGLFAAGHAQGLSDNNHDVPLGDKTTRR